MFLAFLGLSTFVAGEVVGSSANSSQRILVLVLSNVLLLSELVYLIKQRPQGEDKTSEAVILPAAISRDNHPSSVGDKQLLGEILSITNKIQSDVDLISSLVSLIEQHAATLNLIHVSTILRKLAQVKLLTPRFVKESVWSSILVPRCTQLLKNHGTESLFFKAAVSTIIALGKAGGSTLSPDLRDSINEFLVKILS